MSISYLTIATIKQNDEYDWLQKWMTDNAQSHQHLIRNAILEKQLRIYKTDV